VETAGKKIQISMQVKSDSSFVNKISGKKLDSKMPSRMD
jgi:hypothetical protein